MDACRGAAALAIVLGHSYTGAAGGRLFDWASELRVGVQVFFGLSGFLLFRPYLAALARNEPPPAVRDFLARRVLRIVPGYWFALTALALLIGPPIVAGVFSPHWWLLYGFGQVYSLTHHADGLAVAWTLSVEASFYLFLPLLAACVGRLAPRLGWRCGTAAVLTLTFAVGVAVRILNQTAHGAWLPPIERVTYGLPGELPYFVVGMGLAAASVHVSAQGRLPRPFAWLIARPAVAWALAAACFAFGATVSAYRSPVALPGVGTLGFSTRFVLNGVLEAVLVAAFLLPAVFEVTPRRRLPQRLLASRPLGFVGLVSYGLYLWHAPVGAWIVRRAPLRDVAHWAVPAGWPVIAAVLLSTGLLAGTLSYYVVELPFLRRKPGWRRDPEPAATTVSPAAEPAAAVARSGG